MEKVAEYAQNFGVIDNMPLQYSMLLGAGETTPLRLTTGYAMIVNGGKKITPTFIDRVQDREGKTIYRADTRPCEGCNGVEWTGQAMPNCPTRARHRGSGDRLSDGLDPAGRRRARHRHRSSAASASRSPARPARPATIEDNWFVGFSPDLAAGVFVGFDNPRTLGEREEGAHNAAPIFRDFMAGALKDKPATRSASRPASASSASTRRPGNSPVPGDKTVIYEAFKPGTEPTGDSVVVNGYRASDWRAAGIGQRRAGRCGGAT